MAAVVVAEMVVPVVVVEVVMVMIAIMLIVALVGVVVADSNRQTVCLCSLVRPSGSVFHFV